jgi:NACHT domain
LTRASEHNEQITNRVVEYFDGLFVQVFSDPFSGRIAEMRRRRAVERQVQETADAASQSLTRFFLNEQLELTHVQAILEQFANLGETLPLERISNPNVTPESVAETIQASLSDPEGVKIEVFRLALYSIVQVLMQVGPVMAEWQRLNFSSEFSLPRLINERLNRISEQFGVLSRAGQEAADERYELSYRDFLAQRFNKVEAGTVRMTTNMDVDLRELFVMPKVLPRPQRKTKDNPGDPNALMSLQIARRSLLGEREDGPRQRKRKPATVLEQVRKQPRNVLIGAPGSGKSTFLEWLQVKVAFPEEHDEFVLAEKQAIPLLLRVRQLDPNNLPTGAALVEKAVASKDIAGLMPPGWIDRQMKAGRVLFMLDGLDEVDPDLRDTKIIPWLLTLSHEYKHCHFLISSRPVGYPTGSLSKLKVVECDLLDFDEPQMLEYTQHWCTAIRLTRNEPEEEARREGKTDGSKIVDGFNENPYVRNLARNPLMLSAVCLVNYFEGGELPRDRGMLYRLCVEGLLHNWDHRRGIQSEFSLTEKLRVCRELAIEMQEADQAEYKVEKVLEVFEYALRDKTRAEVFLEHIRYRTGLLIERRPGVFAFAHLTFQEYLAAQAVLEGNRRGINIEKIAQDHASEKWNEVISIFCGISPVSQVKIILSYLIKQEILDSEAALKFENTLFETYIASPIEIKNDSDLTYDLIEKILLLPFSFNNSLHIEERIKIFKIDQVYILANQIMGSHQHLSDFSNAFMYLLYNSLEVNTHLLIDNLNNYRNKTSLQLTELLLIAHGEISSEVIPSIAEIDKIYLTNGHVDSGGSFVNY